MTNALGTSNNEPSAPTNDNDGDQKQWRQLRVEKLIDESSVIRSFHFEPVDGEALSSFDAGQHLPIRFMPFGGSVPLLRTYTLSTAPSDNLYRISVKRQGIGSSHLHDNVKVGDIIEARAPAGAFTMDAHEARPAVLLGAGVGVTPMLAMLRHIVAVGRNAARIRPTVFFYAARSRAERAFDRELAELIAQADGAVAIKRVLGTADDAQIGTDYDAIGQIDLALLKSTLGFDDHEFYMCGPPPFMQSVYDALRSVNVADKRIHAEAFGPASLQRTPDVAAPPAAPLLAAADAAVPVQFRRSDVEARWEPGPGSLLELAESSGLTPDYGCRGGRCGTCRTRIIAGKVAYATQPEFDVEPGEALICCAMPAVGSDADTNKLILDL